MNIVLIFLIVVVFIIIVGVLIHESKVFSPPQPYNLKNGITGQSTSEQQSNIPLNALLSTPTWSAPVPYNPKSTGTCLPYTFIGGDYVPAYPSYSKLNSDDGRGFLTGNVGQTCIDPDQLFAYTVAHECVSPQGTAAGTGCILTVPTVVNNGSAGYELYHPGQYAPIGTVEGVPNSSLDGGQLYYAPCTPSNLANNFGSTVYCNGSIGLIIPNFTPQSNYDTPTNTCLMADQTDPNFKANGYYETLLEACDLSQQGQIFRTVRYDMDANFNLKQSDTGRLAAIIHRATGYYLAPNIDLIPNIVTVGNTGVNQPYLDFEKLNIDYHPAPNPLKDKFENSFYESVQLVLVNPSYDTSRNGVYWLFQNQMVNPQIDPYTTTQSNFQNFGIYPNQENYTTQFPSGPNEQSYYWAQTIKKLISIGNPVPDGCTGVPGNINPGEIVGYWWHEFIDAGTPPNYTACSGKPGMNPGTTTYDCWFNTSVTVKVESGTYNTITYNAGGVTGVQIDQAPQQIVYVPNLYLLPSVNADTTGMWNYLVNNFSINVVNTSTDVNPVYIPALTPYRQNYLVDTVFSITNDNTTCPTSDLVTQALPCTNLFFTFQGILPNSSGNSDTQFIDYTQFIPQIQTGVSSRSLFIGGNQTYPPMGNPNYASKSNPLIPPAN